jgi:UDP-glucose 4-epimerase
MLVHRNEIPVKPARVLILGAGGFLSPRLKGALERDGVPTKCIGSKEIDLMSEDAGTHLASQIRPDDALVMPAALTPDKGRDVPTLMKNLKMAEAVCSAVARSAPAHFVYISSDSVYEGKSSMLNEDSSCEPTDLYGLMHIAREKMLGQSCRAAGIPISIIRPCAIYGTGDTHNSYGPNRFVRKALKDGKITLFGGGEEQRHHVHIFDVVELARLCLLHQSDGIINGITTKAISFREVAETVRNKIGSTVQLEMLPRSSPITHRLYDLTNLARTFPHFSPTSLEEGISEMISGMAKQA